MRLKERPHKALDGDLVTRPAHIVLAEDDHELRCLLAAALREDGHEVIVARDGAQLAEHLGSRCLRHEFPDLVITDVRMPGGNGLDILASIRERNWTTPFIVITAFADEALREEALRLGAAAVLDKPFDIDALRAIVLFVLRGAKP